eukprot:SAG31_NODE_2826_length_5035_cov_2.062601_3_plen_149_part_00
MNGTSYAERSYRATLSRLARGFSVRTWEIQQEKSHKTEKVTVLTGRRSSKTTYSTFRLLFGRAAAAAAAFSAAGSSSSSGDSNMGPACSADLPRIATRKLGRAGWGPDGQRCAQLSLQLGREQRSADCWTRGSGRAARQQPLHARCTR